MILEIRKRYQNYNNYAVKKTGDILIDYLQHRIKLKKLVNWAENAMMDDNSEKKDLNLLHDVIDQIVLADVMQFGMTREKCEEFSGR